MPPLPRRLASLLCVLLLVGAVSGCYLPARFDAEITVNRRGFYSTEFLGFLAWVPLYQKLHNREISRSEELEKVAIIKKDLRRDDAVETVSYFKKGHFKVHYKASGDLLKLGMATFIRRNEDILTVQYNKDNGLITVRGKYLRKEDADRLADMGLWLEGELRLKTDTRVISHNATEVREGSGREKTLVWQIKSPYDPAPKATMAFR